MGIMTEVVKALCTDSGKSFVKNVATGVLSVMIAKAIVDSSKVNKKISSFERDLDRAEAAIDEALGRPRRRERYLDEDIRFSRERERYYRRGYDEDREYSDERPRRSRREEYTGRRR